MTLTVANLWRHPIKSHGREALETVTLVAGQAMPWDRHWAIAHADARTDVEGWMPCSQFLRGARIPAVAGLWARLEEATGTVHLQHRALGEYSVQPDDPDQIPALFDWLEPLYRASRSAPARVINIGGRGMTDTDFPSISVMTHASHAAVADRMGGDLEPERWRGNIWLDGAEAWDEFDWVGKRLQIGAALIDIVSPIERCPHTEANPMTGIRDRDTLATLDGFGHRDFGIYGVVIEGGDIALGDRVEVI